MKITHLKTFIVYAFRSNWVFVKLYTDEGITGVGEGTVDMREATLAQCIEEMGRYLVGKDPFAIEHHIHLLNRDSYWRNGVILRSALSAVEAAMYDIKGKALGVPVYELLGGQCRERIKCYANAWFAGADTPADFAALAKQAVAKGFRALKFDPFGKAHRGLEPAERERAMDVVEAVREAVGWGVDLLIEVHGRLDVPDAVTIANQLAVYRPYWFEEPLPPGSLKALAEVRHRIPIPIAAGERFYEPERALEALTCGAVDYLQVDACHIGGLMDTKRVAAMADVFSKSIAPHNPNGPVCNAMTLHIAASTPNFGMLETMANDVEWRLDVAHEDLDLVDGYMVIPDRPGLGIDIDEEAAASHPYDPRDLRHYTGALTKIRSAGSCPWFRVRTTEAVSV